MSKLKTFTSIILLLAAITAGAQSYERLEKRFVKEELSKEDSLAFIKQGLQKAQTLFLRGNELYLSNQHNTANQAYIQSTLPRLFYQDGKDSLQVDSLLRLLPRFQLLPGHQSVKYKTLASQEHLQHLVSTNLKPQLELDLKIVLLEKSFGSTTERVWQVFLANPVWQDFKSR
jgi:hypothetical protein